MVKRNLTLVQYDMDTRPLFIFPILVVNQGLGFDHLLSRLPVSNEVQHLSIVFAGSEFFPPPIRKAAEDPDISLSSNLLWDRGKQTPTEHGPRGGQALCKENMGVLPVSSVSEWLPHETGEGLLSRTYSFFPWAKKRHCICPWTRCACTIFCPRTEISWGWRVHTLPF